MILESIQKNVLNLLAVLGLLSAVVLAVFKNTGGLLARIRMKK